MSTVLVGVNVPTLKSMDFVPALTASIRSSENEARDILAKGRSVREVHDRGLTNASECSSAEKEVTLADLMISHDSEKLQEDMGRPFFGAHIRRTIRVFRSAFGK